MVGQCHESLQKGFIKSYNEKSKEEYFFEVDIQYPESLHNENESWKN